MKRALWPYLLFALAGAGLALWVTLQRGPKHQEGAAWESFKAEEIRSVSFETAKLKVRFSPLSLNYGWIDYAEAGKPSRTFLAGTKGKDFWFNLSPLWASKVLGDAKHLKLSEYGLDQEDKTFTIELRDARKLAYRIGGRGFQSSDFFVLDLQRQSVFLWDRMTVSLLERAPTRLALDTLSFLNPEGLNKIVLTSDGQTRSLLREAKAWREGAKPVSSEEAFLKWLDRVSKLKISGQREQGGSKNEPLFSLALEGDNAFDLRFSFDAAAKIYVISLGEGKPQILLDEKAFGPFYEEFRSGILVPKT